MTNLDKIRSMTDEELIKFLATYVDPSELAPGYCDNRCPYGASCDDCGAIDCEVSDEMIIEEWGKRKVEEVGDDKAS